MNHGFLLLLRELFHGTHRVVVQPQDVGSPRGLQAVFHSSVIQAFHEIPRRHIGQLVGLNSVSRTRHIQHKRTRLQMGGQNLDDRRRLQAAIYVDTILDDLRMKLQRNGTGRL
jgi:hypothetical protein